MFWTLIEILGVISGLACVYLASQKNIWTWPVGIVNVILYFFLFMHSGLYAVMSLQIFFLVLSIYGWIKWGRTSTHYYYGTQLDAMQYVFLMLLIIMFIINIAAIMIAFNIQLSEFNLILDVTILVVSIFATILMAEKILDSWYLWIFVNLISIVLFTIHGLYFLSAQCTIFIILDIQGIKKWKKTEI